MPGSVRICSEYTLLCDLIYNIYIHKKIEQLSKEIQDICLYVLPRWHSGKEPTCQCRRHRRCRFNPWDGKITWSRKWQLAPVFLPGKFHGQRTLAGYSPWSCEELDTTEWPNTHVSVCTHIQWLELWLMVYLFLSLTSLLKMFYNNHRSTT